MPASRQDTAATSEHIMHGNDFRVRTLTLCDALLFASYGIYTQIHEYLHFRVILSIYLFISYVFETKPGFHIVECVDKFILHYCFYPGILYFYELCNARQYFQSGPVGTFLYIFLYWTFLAGFDIVCYKSFCPNGSQLSSSNLRKYGTNIVTTIGVFIVSAVAYITMLGKIGVERDTVFDESVLYIMTDLCFYFAHNAFHMKFSQMHNRHHWVSAKDEHNVMPVFCYASFVENLLISLSLLFFPVIFRCCLGGRAISTSFYLEQITFVCGTHAFCFKHNHRKHHSNQVGGVPGDVFTMLLTRTYETVRILI